MGGGSPARGRILRCAQDDTDKRCLSCVILSNAKNPSHVSRITARLRDAAMVESRRTDADWRGVAAAGRGSGGAVSAATNARPKMRRVQIEITDQEFARLLGTARREDIHLKGV